MIRGIAVYTSIAFTDRLVEEGIDPSVGPAGDAYDNSLAESQIGLYKSELIHHEGPWRDVDQVEAATGRRSIAAGIHAPAAGGNERLYSLHRRPRGATPLLRLFGLAARVRGRPPGATRGR